MVRVQSKNIYGYRIYSGTLRLLLIYLFPEKAGSCISKATPELLSAVLRNFILCKCVLYFTSILGTLYINVQ